MYNPRNVRIWWELGDRGGYFHIPRQSRVVEVLLMIGTGDAISTGGYRCISKETHSALNVAWSNS